MSAQLRKLCIGLGYGVGEGVGGLSMTLLVGQGMFQFQTYDPIPILEHIYMYIILQSVIYADKGALTY